MMQVHVQHSEQRVWIAVDTVGFDGRTHSGLWEYQFCELVRVYVFWILLKELW